MTGKVVLRLGCYPLKKDKRQRKAIAYADLVMALCVTPNKRIIRACYLNVKPHLYSNPHEVISSPISLRSLKKFVALALMFGEPSHDTTIKNPKIHHKRTLWRRFATHKDSILKKNILGDQEQKTQV